MSIKKEMVKKTLFVVLGSMIMGIGIHLMIIANLGSDPLTIFWIGIAKTLSISVGQANILTSVVILSFVYFINKKEINIGSLLNPLVIMISTDFLARFQFHFDNLFVQVIVCVLGLLILAFGVALYSTADFGKGAYEALSFSLNEKYNLSVRLIRTVCDSVFMIVGFLLGARVSIGTFLAIFVMGNSIQFFLGLLKKKSIVEVTE